MSPLGKFGSFQRILSIFATSCESTIIFPLKNFLFYIGVSLRSALGFLWRERCWSWNSSTFAISCEELTHWKRLWCWEGLGAGGEGENRGWDGWMASLTLWTWVWANSGSWWWTGSPGMLQFMGLQRVRHHWVTELSWFWGVSWYIVVVRICISPGTSDEHVFTHLFCMSSVEECLFKAFAHY